MFSKKSLRAQLGNNMLVGELYRARCIGCFVMATVLNRRKQVCYFELAALNHLVPRWVGRLISVKDAGSLSSKLREFYYYVMKCEVQPSKVINLFGLFFSPQAADGNIKTLRQVLYDMRRGDVLEILDGRQDSGFDSGLGSQSLSASRSEGEIRFVCTCD